MDDVQSVHSTVIACEEDLNITYDDIQLCIRQWKEKVVSLYDDFLLCKHYNWLVEHQRISDDSKVLEQHCQKLKKNILERTVYIKDVKLYESSLLQNKIDNKSAVYKSFNNKLINLIREYDLLKLENDIAQYSEKLQILNSEGKTQENVNKYSKQYIDSTQVKHKILEQTIQDTKFCTNMLYNETSILHSANSSHIKMKVLICKIEKEKSINLNYKKRHMNM